MKKLIFTLILTAISNLAISQEFDSRGIETNFIIYVDNLDGSDTNTGTETRPIATITEAVKRTYAYAHSTVYIMPGEYSAEKRLWITNHPKLRFMRWPGIDGNINFTAGFRIQGGSEVIFREIDFEQKGTWKGYPKFMCQTLVFL